MLYVAYEGKGSNCLLLIVFLFCCIGPLVKTTQSLTTVGTLARSKLERECIQCHVCSS